MLTQMNRCRIRRPGSVITLIQRLWPNRLCWPRMRKHTANDFFATAFDLGTTRQSFDPATDSEGSLRPLRRVGDGTNVVSVAYVENAAAAHVQAELSLRDSSKAAGKAYFINERDAVNLWDWINLILAKTGLPPVEKTISTAVGHATWLGAGSCLETVSAGRRTPDDPVYCGSIGRITQLQCRRCGT
jgi:nucleoside-diphosphate-sugar epimerase